MTTIFSLSNTHNPSGYSTLGTVLLEPFFLVASFLFWLIVLPLGGLFCLAVSIYDRIAIPHPRPVHTAAMLRRSPINSFAIGKTGLPFREPKGSPSQIGRRAQA
jgi:hypothetical protein